MPKSEGDRKPSLWELHLMALEEKLRKVRCEKIKLGYPWNSLSEYQVLAGEVIESQFSPFLKQEIFAQSRMVQHQGSRSSFLTSLSICYSARLLVVGFERYARPNSIAQTIVQPAGVFDSKTGKDCFGKVHSFDFFVPGKLFLQSDNRSLLFYLFNEWRWIPLTRGNTEFCVLEVWGLSVTAKLRFYRLRKYPDYVRGQLQIRFTERELPWPKLKMAYESLN